MILDEGQMIHLDVKLSEGDVEQLDEGKLEKLERIVGHM